MCLAYYIFSFQFSLRIVPLTSFSSHLNAYVFLLPASNRCVFYFACHTSKDTVSKKREDDEVDGGEHAAANPSLRLDAMVHDGIPVLSGQDLRDENGPERLVKKHEISQRSTLQSSRLIEGLSVRALRDSTSTQQSFPQIKMRRTNLWPFIHRQM